MIAAAMARTMHQGIIPPLSFLALGVSLLEQTPLSSNLKSHGAHLISIVHRARSVNGFLVSLIYVSKLSVPIH